ncbi:1-deoxy-D-xylulose-5-phosphate synthase [Streptomyces sp. NPDC003077]|uniref:1-deoxy-D-xylulose-5-phosphate synthase n=1 Tax=Streptomyces sp. NPDC003077 TaxID=3154443 RepID=UPI0033A7BE1C
MNLTPPLPDISHPDRLRDFDGPELARLAERIRAFLVDTVTASGGHLGPNLGVVELTIALHRVFDSPRDTLLFDIGHQAYVHKVLTGRAKSFEGLRRGGGLSGYPSRTESDHDHIENSHASTALSYADGIAKARALRGEADRRVVAVVGDGGLTGGAAFEALNNIGGAPDRPVVVVLNDNGRSYAPTVGALADHLRGLRHAHGAADGGTKNATDAKTAIGDTEAVINGTEAAIDTKTAIGDTETASDDAKNATDAKTATDSTETATDGTRNATGIKNATDTKDTETATSSKAATPPRAQGTPPPPTQDHAPPPPSPRPLFETLGFHYLGPVDGHDLPAMEAALRRAREVGRPVLVHVVTVKGKGYPPAEADEEDRLHTVGVVDPATARSRKPAAQTWTEVFGAELRALAAARADVVAVTAAMPGPTGVAELAAASPHRVFDVGIAEQHAVASAAGLAMGGCHPVVALYATFLNRAYDQVLMDVALHRLPVTFVLDRAGITGPDGPSHHGLWDLSLLSTVPGLRVAVPRDAPSLRALLREAVEDENGPTALRFPKAAAGTRIPAARREGGLDVLTPPGGREVLLVSVGPLAAGCVSAAADLTARGIGATVVDPRWVFPVPAALVQRAAAHRLVVTVEDNSRAGGVGAAVSQACRDAGIRTPVINLGLPRAFLTHGTREDLLRHAGLDASGIVRTVLRFRAGRVPSPVPSPVRSASCP